MDLFRTNERKIDEIVKEALSNSKTYEDAIRYVDIDMKWALFWHLERQAAKEKIIQKACENQLRLNSEQVDKVEKNVLGDLSVRVDVGNMEEVKKLIDELVVKLKEANELIDELASKKNIKISLETSFD